MTARRDDIHGVVCLHRYVRDSTLRQRPRYTPACGRRGTIESALALLATPFRTVP
jgi:hypothetical protein